MGRPRASDAVAVALRDAFAGHGREPCLPDDMAALLRRLNGYPHAMH